MRLVDRMLGTLSRYLPFTTADSNFFVDRDIRDWPRVVALARGDPVLAVETDTATERSRT